MKQLQRTLMVVIALAAFAVAQQKQTPQGQPAPAQQAPAAAQGKTPPQAKTQEEFKAYQDAVQAQDGPAAEKAADDFAAKFKTSELRHLLYYRAMTMYQNMNNAEKAIDMGRKVLAINPNEPISLAMVANFLSERTRETDLDRDERLNEALQDANKSLKVVDTELIVPPGTAPAAVEANKNLLRSIAYAAIGNVYLAKNDYAQAEQNLKTSIDLNKMQPDAVTWLRYSVVLDHQKKYQDALVAANKALEFSPPGSPQANMAKQEHDRLLKLTGAAAPASAPAAPATATTPAAPATTTTQSPPAPATKPQPQQQPPR